MAEQIYCVVFQELAAISVPPCCIKQILLKLYKTGITDYTKIYQKALENMPTSCLHSETELTDAFVEYCSVLENKLPIEFNSKNANPAAEGHSRNGIAESDTPLGAPYRDDGFGAFYSVPKGTAGVASLLTPKADPSQFDFKDYMDDSTALLTPLEDLPPKQPAYFDCLYGNPQGASMYGVNATGESVDAYYTAPSEVPKPPVKIHTKPFLMPIPKKIPKTEEVSETKTPNVNYDHEVSNFEESFTPDAYDAWVKKMQVDEYNTNEDALDSIPAPPLQTESAEETESTEEPPPLPQKWNCRGCSFSNAAESAICRICRLSREKGRDIIPRHRRGKD